MNTGQNIKLLRIYASSTDKLKGQPFYEFVVIKARENGLAGATVLKGIMGYGASSKIHSARLWEITEKLPIVIEIIDEGEKIDHFVSYLKSDLPEMPKGCLVTEEQVQVSLHQTGGSGEASQQG